MEIKEIVNHMQFLRRPSLVLLTLITPFKFATEAMVLLVSCRPCNKRFGQGIYFVVG